MQNENNNKLILFVANLLQLVISVIDFRKWGENPKAVATTWVLIISLVANYFWGYAISEEIKAIAVIIFVALIGFFLRKWNIPVKSE